MDNNVCEIVHTVMPMARGHCKKTKPSTKPVPAPLIPTPPLQLKYVCACVATHGLCWTGIRGLKLTQTFFLHHLLQMAKLVQMASDQESQRF